MSIHKLQKYINRTPTPITGTKIYTPDLFSDSKGKYLERQAQPGGINGHILNWCESSRTTTKGFNWLQENLSNRSRHLNNISYVWLGTCDLTNYNQGYISLHEDCDEAISDAINNFEGIVEIFKDYPNHKLTFIETPPYSIYEWNKHHKHQEPNQYISQDSILVQQVNRLNDAIRTININLQSHSPALTTDINHNQSRTSRNRHRRRRDRYNFKLYKDGVHPNPLLARVWQRKICE